MKLYLIRLILLLLLLETFVIIFGFSSQNGEDSSSISKRVTEIIVDTFKKDISIQERNNLVKKTEIIVRKLAHFSIYSLVGLLLMFLANTYDLSFKRKLFICLLIGIIYATSDEIHQLFIAGRSGQIIDVFIDTLGVLAGILISNAIVVILNKIKRNQKVKLIEKN